MDLDSMAVLEAGTFLASPAAPDEWGLAWLRIASFVDAKLSTLKPKPVALGFESPFIPPPPPKKPGAKRFAVNWETLRFLFGVVAMFEMVAARHGIRPREVNVQTVKASLAGAAKKKERDAELEQLRGLGVDKDTLKARQRELMKITKEDMEAAAKRLGWKVADHHQADACGVGKVIIENHYRGERNDVTRNRKLRRLV